MRSPARSTWWWRRRSDPPPLMRFIFAKHVKSLGGPSKIGRFCVGGIPRPGAGDFCRQTKVTKSWLRTKVLRTPFLWQNLGVHGSYFEMCACRLSQELPEEQTRPLGAPTAPGRSMRFYRNSVELLPPADHRRMSQQSVEGKFPPITAGRPLWGGKRTAGVTALGDVRSVLRQRMGDPFNVRKREV